MATGYGSIESAIEALKLGAHEYITKPFHLDELRIIVRKALEFQEIKEQNIHLKDLVDSRSQFSSIIGESPRMQQLFELGYGLAAKGYPWEKSPPVFFQNTGTN